MKSITELSPETLTERFQQLEDGKWIFDHFMNCCYEEMRDFGLKPREQILHEAALSYIKNRFFDYQYEVRAEYQKRISYQR